MFLHLKKHGLGFVLDQDYDQLQLEYLFVKSWQTLKSLNNDPKSYNTPSLNGIIDGYPFHDTHQDPALEPTFLIEEYFPDRIYKKPSGQAVLLDDDVNDEVNVNGEEVGNTHTNETKTPRNTSGKHSDGYG